MSQGGKCEFDELLSRTLLAVIGVALLFVAAIVFYIAGSVDKPIVLIGLLLLGFGVFLSSISIFGTKEAAYNFSRTTENHAVMMIFILVSVALTHGIRRISKDA